MMTGAANYTDLLIAIDLGSPTWHASSGEARYSREYPHPLLEGVTISDIYFHAKHGYAFDITYDLSVFKGVIKWREDSYLPAGYYPNLGEVDQDGVKRPIRDLMGDGDYRYFSACTNPSENAYITERQFTTWLISKMRVNESCFINSSK